MAILINCTNAFYFTWRFKIIKKLRKWNLRGSLPLFIKNFLEEISFQVKTSNRLSTSHIQENRVPQGFVINPTLFNVAIYDISSILQKLVKASLYADDLVIFRSCVDPSVGQEILQESINQLDQWALTIGFQ